MMQIRPRSIARGFIARTRIGSFARVEFFDRVDRVGFAFFTRTDILLSESLWSLRSAHSKYRIERGGFVGAFTRTDILLNETR
jgi:hypothetical protein